MEQQRYRGARLQESDALVNPNDEQQATPSSGAANVTPSSPARQPTSTSPTSTSPTSTSPTPTSPTPPTATPPATSHPAPGDEAEPDDQVTLVAERQPGASAIGMPTPALNGSVGAYSPHAAGPDDATAHDSPRQWLPPRVAQPTPPPQPPARRQQPAPA
ncbi:MAG: hypothetical protein ACRDHE_09215, partial [Ktedonobacterales bacterium]